MQNFLVFASVTYIILFSLVAIGSGKLIISEKTVKVSFSLLTVSLSVFAYYLNPPLGVWDLGKHFIQLNNIRNCNLSMRDFLFHNYAGVGGNGYTSLITFNFLRYTLAKVSDNNHLLPCLCILIDYIIISYIMIDWSADNTQDGRVKFTSVLLCYSFLPYVHAISGMRNALAASVMGLGIYLYVYKRKNIVVFIILTIIAATIHQVVLIAIPFVFLISFENGIKSFLIVFLASVSADGVASFFLKSSISYLRQIARLYKRYTSDGQYRSGRYCLYGDIILMCILLIMYLIQKRKDIAVFCDERNKKLYSFLMCYMCYILGNIGNYDMVLRPCYLLGVFAPVLAALVTDTEEWDHLNNKIVFYTGKILICILCIYICYKHTEILLTGIESFGML